MKKTVQEKETLETKNYLVEETRIKTVNMSTDIVHDIGAIVNVRSFDSDKNPNIASIFNKELWGFSTRYCKRWNFLRKGVRVLFYGDKGIRIAATVREKHESREPVREWANSTGYPYHIIMNFINKQTENTRRITKDELVDVYDIPLAKRGFRGMALTIFGMNPKEKDGITYPIEKFNEIWSKFLERNDLHEKPSQT